MPTNPNEARFSGLQLRQALTNLDRVLGRTIVELIIYDLERQGIVLGEHRSYALDQIIRVFKTTFGEDGTSLLVERLCKELDG